MTEEKQVHVENNENTVALIGMILSIIGLILVLTLVFFRIGIPLLVLGLLLGLIGLCSKPRGKARTAVLISLITLGGIAALIIFVRNAMKTPAINFLERTQQEVQKLNIENFDEDKFDDIAEEESRKIIQSLTKEELNNLYETSTGSNSIEKWSYLFFSLVQQGTENALNKYKEQLPDQVIEEENTANEELSNSNETIEENTETQETQKVNEERDTSNDTEVFTDSEQSDIEQIINILE